jgi:hypothetical protein
MSRGTVWKKFKKFPVGMTIRSKAGESDKGLFLNKQWRAIYVIVGDKIKIVRVIEVHPHEY